MLQQNSKNQLVKKIQEKLYMSSNEGFINSVKEKLINEERFSKNDYWNYRDIKLLSLLPEEELFWFCDAMEKSNSKIIKTTNYFTENEIKEFQTYVREKIKIEDLYVLKNAYPLTPDKKQWSCVASVKQIAQMNKYNIITVDPYLQRQSKMISLSGKIDEILRKININKKRVNEIAEKISNRDYKFNSIRFNLIDDGEHAPKLNNKSEIVLPEGGMCICLDGNHRQKACVQEYYNCKDKNKLKYYDEVYFNIIFTWFTPQGARETISQEWNVEPIRKSSIEAMKINMENRVVDLIKNNSNVEPLFLKNIIISGEERMSNNGGFIVYSFLSDAINRQYKSSEIKLNAEAMSLANWIVEFYNYLTVLFVDDFSNVTISKKTKWVTELYTTYGFIYLSKILQNDKDWKNKINIIINKINWNKEASPINVNKTRANIPIIEKYFANIIGECNV